MDVSEFLQRARAACRVDTYRIKRPAGKLVYLGKLMSFVTHRC